MWMVQVPLQVWRAMIDVLCAQILGLLLAQFERLERMRTQFAMGDPVAHRSRLDVRAPRTISWVLVAMGWQRAIERGAAGLTDADSHGLTYAYRPLSPSSIPCCWSGVRSPLRTQ
jgi:hypothetical protein